jgi:hypothetical protein
MAGKDQQYLRIFIGSPGDIKAERDIAYKVISDVEEIFQIFKDHGSIDSIPPLRAIGWEKVASDAGLPNEIILNRFPVTHSNICIFIFWKRLGTPPNTQSHSGKPFSSGTEQEFINAFEQRRKSQNGRPIIMLYRKTDDVSIIGMNNKERKQYDKVASFFQECEPDGKHPTLIFDFKTGEFETNLRKHLLDNILKFFKTSGEEDIPQNKKNIIEEKQEETSQDDQSSKTWLESNFLFTNPFHLRFAEDESDLAKYYVRFNNLQLNMEHLLNDKNGWLIFGREGSGKTALRKFLISKHEGNPRVHCVEYSDEGGFVAAITKDQDPEKIALSIATQIYETASKNTNISPLDLQSAADPSSVFLLLQEGLKAQGVEKILILFDPFRETVKEAVKDMAKVASVLARLANLSLDGIGLRFFLPKNVYVTLSNKQHAYIGRCNPMEIKWGTDELLKVIQRRLSYYSTDKRSAPPSMGALGEPKGGMERIDQAIVNLSENNPRAVIWLADQLISKHCQIQPIPLKIQRQTWDQVQEEWWSWGRNHVLGLPGQKEAFWQSGSDFYFKDERLDLSKRSKTLLGTLLEAEGQICSKERLIESGWAHENREGITEKALREAMRRLKNELAKGKNWLKTVHGQGYRLQNPDEA